MGNGLQFNGIVGGTKAVAVAGGKSILLQQNVVAVAKGKKLVLRSLNFMFNNDAFAFKLEALPSTGKFIARDGFGILTPNKVLFNNTTGSAVILFLEVNAVNTVKSTRTLSRSDSWRFTLVQV